MTATTQTVRDRAFLPLSSDIPEGLTITQYRVRRSRAAARARRPRVRLGAILR
jgi:hypothetical protein